MKEYIDKNELIKDLVENKSFFPAIVKRAIERAEVCDVVPRNVIYQIFRDIWDICQETDDDEIIIDQKELNILERKYGVL